MLPGTVEKAAFAAFLLEQVQLVLHEAQSLQVGHLVAALDELSVLRQVVLALVHHAKQKLVDARVGHGGQPLVAQGLLVGLDQGEFVDDGALGPGAALGDRGRIAILARVNVGLRRSLMRTAPAAASILASTPSQA